MGEVNQAALKEQALLATQAWFERVVLGLNLCPYAHQPAKSGSIRFCTFFESDEESLFECLARELELLANSAAGELETTLIVLPVGFEDFFFYLSMLEAVDNWLAKNGWEGLFQVASFHPNYQFDGSSADDRGNLTNRSPYPILHLLREESLTQIFDSGADTAAVPERNIARITGLTDAEVGELFPYIHQKPL